MSPNLKETKTATHTSGPWTSDEQGLIYADGDTIALVYDNPDRGDEPMGEEPSEYNKKLICAAPELLGALKVALDALEWYDNGENKAVAQGAMKEIKTAITKATA